MCDEHGIPDLTHVLIRIGNTGATTRETTFKLIELLLSERRYDVNCEDNFGGTLLEYLIFPAILHEIQWKVLNIIKNTQNLREIHLKNTTSFGKSMLFEAMRSHLKVTAFKYEEYDIRVLKMVLDLGLNPNEPEYLLAYAVDTCGVEVCRLLLDHWAHPDSTLPSEDERLSGFIEVGADFARTVRDSRETALHMSPYSATQLLKLSSCWMLAPTPVSSGWG